MAAYVRHVARDRAAALERLDALTAEYKAKAKAAGVQGHARTAGILGDLAAGFRLFAEWAASVGAIQTEVGARLADQHWSWLVTLADDQQEQQDESDDARRSASAAQVNQAVEAAYAAFRRPDWRKLTGRERGKLLLQLAQLLRRDLESFATLETLDTGIPIRETRMQIATAAAHLEYFAGLAGSIEGSYQDLGDGSHSLRDTTRVSSFFPGQVSRSRLIVRVQES